MNLSTLRVKVNGPVMDGFWKFLIRNNKITVFTAQMYVNIVRKFHNYVGKPYVDINKEDIQDYLTYLTEVEHLKFDSLSRHRAAIRQFFRYILSRGEADWNPCEGIRIKRW